MRRLLMLYDHNSQQPKIMREVIGKKDAFDKPYSQKTIGVDVCFAFGAVWQRYIL
jgi:hypothetical protein